MQLMDEDYADAYEFICSLEPAVQDLVKTIPMNIGNGFPHQEHLRENAAKKIGMMLSKLPVQNIQVDDILKLNNLDNMPQDPYMVKALTNIIQNLLSENLHLRDLSVGTLETLKLMPGYDEAIEQLKESVTKKENEDGTIEQNTK